MTFKKDRQRELPYEGSLFRPRKKKSRAASVLKGAAGAVVVVGLIVLAQTQWNLLGAFSAHLPVPHRLEELVLEVNAKRETIPPDGEKILNPRDAVRFVGVKTDGWFSWGVKVRAPELDFHRVHSKAAVLRDLFPAEPFETPKTLAVEATWMGKRLGGARLVIQLDAKDWMSKAQEAGKTEDKIRFLEKVLESEPRNVLAKTQLAALYAEAGRASDAERLYEEVLELGQSRPVLERLIGVYKKQKKHAKVVEASLNLLQLSEDAQVFQDLLGYLQNNVPSKEALTLLKHYAGKVPAKYRGSWHLVRADLATKTENWSEAAQAYESAVASGVRDPNIHYNLSVVRTKSGDLDQAAEDLEKYLRANPNDVTNWLKLAAMYEKAGEESKAVKIYRDVVAKSPSEKRALVRLVALLEKSGDKNELLKIYENLARLDPDDRVVQWNLAMLSYEAKQWDKALSAFEKCAALSPNDPKPLKYLLDLYQKNKDQEKQIAVLQKLIAVDRDNLAYYDALFTLYDQARNYDAIIKVFEEASKNNPKVKAFHEYLLYGALKKGQKQKALAALEELCRLEPKEVKYFKQAAQLHESLGQYSKALEKIKRVLEINPNDAAAKDDYLRLRLLLVAPKKTGFFYCTDKPVRV
ncbi:MAG: tetratricopeptide repeat protein [Desulfosoma sp.]